MEKDVVHLQEEFQETHIHWTRLVTTGDGEMNFIYKQVLSFLKTLFKSVAWILATRCLEPSPE